MKWIKPYNFKYVPIAKSPHAKFLAYFDVIQEIQIKSSRYFKFHTLLRYLVPAQPMRVRYIVPINTAKNLELPNH